ncbi:MAG: LPS export ABC transporter ATP-binding protein [Candidatus Sumerlaeia bacterium]
MDDTLRTDNIVKKYGGRTVVKKVNIELRRGEIVGLLGPNGAGKTTSFNIIVGFIRPNEGRVFVNGQDMTGLPMYKRARLGVGYLPQEMSVFRKLTVEQNILAIFETLNLSRKEQLNGTQEILEELEIAHLAKQKAYTLSGGERRRVEIARALVTQPKFLLLDEPFSGVDPKVVEELQKLIKGMKKRGLGVMITDHNARETLHVTDRSYIIYDGEIKLAGSATELVNNEEARRLYFGESFYINIQPEKQPTAQQQAKS